MEEQDLFIPKKLHLENLKKGSVTFKAPSNIALVKYWGKEALQIPKNASISFTLSACFTLTTLEFALKPKPTDTFDFELYFEDKIQESFKPKIKTFFERIESYLPFLKDYVFTIHTRNSFPHSSGIASSASGFAALSLCLMYIEKELNPTLSDVYFNKKASFLARLGSGSASRSIEGQVVVWGKHPAIDHSANILGVKFPYPIHSNFKNYHDTILLVDKGEKQVSSTVGHQLMNNHPFSEQRFKQAYANLDIMSIILQKGDLNEFIALVESEALTLHAMMMTSMPYFILMKSNTLQIIEKIWAFRNKTKTHICFTLDAGANVHVLYPEKEKEIINDFITNNLIAHCQNNQYICDRIGLGATML